MIENYDYILFARDYVVKLQIVILKIACRYKLSVKVNTSSHGIFLLKPKIYIVRLDVIYKMIK